MYGDIAVFGTSCSAAAAVDDDADDYLDDLFLNGGCLGGGVVQICGKGQ